MMNKLLPSQQRSVSFLFLSLAAFVLNIKHQEEKRLKILPPTGQNNLDTLVLSKRMHERGNARRLGNYRHRSRPRWATFSHREAALRQFVNSDTGNL